MKYKLIIAIFSNKLKTVSPVHRDISPLDISPKAIPPGYFPWVSLGDVRVGHGQVKIRKGRLGSCLG